VLTKPNQRIRADLLAPGSADVVGRSEVDFVVDLPVTDTNVQVADTPAAQVEDSAPTSEPATPTVTEAPAPIAEPDVASTEADAPATADAAPAAVVADPAPATPEVTASEPATPAATEAETAAVASEPEAPRSEPIPLPAETVVAADTAPQDVAPAADAQPAVPTLVAVSVGDPEAQRFASGKAIIRRGDNLWTIARRVYGEGIKYTTIYEANTGQIRDPNRIYPGQVFGLPEQASGQ
jgi:nucleoid-associated protein YgaU